MDLMFKNGRGRVFPHTTESWEETVEVARLHGFEKSGVLTTPRPGENVPDEVARALAVALERAVREDLGEHSVMADFAALLRGGSVSVEE